MRAETDILASYRAAARRLRALACKAGLREAVRLLRLAEDIEREALIRRDEGEHGPDPIR